MVDPLSKDTSRFQKLSSEDDEMYVEDDWSIMDRERRRLQQIALTILREFPIDNDPVCDDPDDNRWADRT